MNHPIWEDVGKYCRYVPLGRNNGTVKLEDHQFDPKTGADIFLVKVIATGPIRTRQRFWASAWHLELIEEEGG